jgi:hypothetical protein
MPAMLIRDKITDDVTWRPVFNERELTWRAKGSRGGRIFRSAGDPNEVVILLE